MAVADVFAGLSPDSAKPAIADALKPAAHITYMNNAAGLAAQQIDMMSQQNTKHDEAVAAGKTAIDDAFSGFNQPYYDAYGAAYKNNYEPGLDQDYSLAKGKLTAILAGRDTLDGTVGANALSQQQKTYNNAQGDIANHAADAQNGLRSTVDNTKGQLYAQNINAADPLSMAAQAQAQAGALVAPQSYPTLSNVFADGLSALGTANKANAGSMNPAPWNVGGGGPPLASGNGSALFG